MTTFTLPDLSCGHCVQAVTRAVQAEDPDARVEVDLASKRASIISSVSESRLREVLAAADYPPR